MRLTLSQIDEAAATANEARNAADFYLKNPGLVQPATVVDLYRTIARLADLLATETKP